MTATENMRKKLGISQQHLADYLGLSRSHLSLIEKHLRDIPTSALFRLNELEILLSKDLPETGLNQIFESDNQKLAAFYTDLLEENQITIRVLENELSQMELKAAQAKQTLKLAHYQLATESLNYADQLWFEILIDTAEKTWLNNGTFEQAKLKMKISILKTEMDLALEFQFKSS